MGLLSALRALATATTSADSTAQGTGVGTPSLMLDGATTYGGALWTRARTIVRTAASVATAFSEPSIDPDTGGLNVALVGGAVGGSTVAQGNANGDATKGWSVRLTNGTVFIPLPTALGSNGGLKVTSVGTQAAAASPTTGTLTVNGTEAALSGSSPTGFTLLNESTAGQKIYLGGPGVDTSGFPLAVNGSIDRASWQDLSLVHAIASADGAILKVISL